MGVQSARSLSPHKRRRAVALASGHYESIIMSAGIIPARFVLHSSARKVVGALPTGPGAPGSTAAVEGRPRVGPDAYSYRMIQTSGRAGRVSGVMDTASVSGRLMCSRPARNVLSSSIGQFAVTGVL